MREFITEHHEEDKKKSEKEAVKLEIRDHSNAHFVSYSISKNGN